MDTLLRATPTERHLIREKVYSGFALISLMDNRDGTWAIDIGDVIFEGPSASEVLRELATILGES